MITIIINLFFKIKKRIKNKPIVIKYTFYFPDNKF